MKVVLNSMVAASELEFEDEDREKQGGKENNPFLVSFRFELSCPSPWKIAYCRLDQARMTLMDSHGGVCDPSRCSYGFDSLEGNMSVTSKGWTPAPGSRWIALRGTIPVVVSRSEAVMESVPFSLEKGTTASVVLKNAVWKGSSCGKTEPRVEVRLERIRGGEISEDSVILMNLRVKSPVVFGFRKCEILDTDGTPFKESVQQSTGAENNGYGEGRYVWNRLLVLKGSREEGRKLVLWHLPGERVVDVPVDVKVGLSGMWHSEKSGKRKEK